MGALGLMLADMMPQACMSGEIGVCYYSIVEQNSS